MITLKQYLPQASGCILSLLLCSSQPLQPGNLASLQPYLEVIFLANSFGVLQSCKISLLRSKPGFYLIQLGLRIKVRQ